MRSLAAILGGYLVAALLSVAMAAALPIPTAEAVIWGMLASIPAWCVLWMASFAVRSAGRAWAVLLLSTLLLGGLYAFMRWGAGA